MGDRSGNSARDPAGRMYQQHGMYYEGQGGDMPHQHDSWAEVNAVLVSRGGASEGVSSVAFDRIEV